MDIAKSALGSFVLKEKVAISGTKVALLEQLKSIFLPLSSSITSVKPLGALHPTCL